MKMNKLLIALLSTSMIATSVAFADEDANIETTNLDEVVVCTDYNKVIVKGEVSAVEDETLLIDDAQGIAFDELSMFATQDGMPILSTDVKVGDKVMVVADERQTKSVPPISYGYVVVVNNDTEAVAPIYAEILSVTEDEGLVLESADGEYNITVTDDTEIVPFATRNIIGAKDLKAGDKILFYSETMTMSIPALVNPTKIVVLEQAIVEEETEADVQPKTENTPVDLTKVDSVKVMDEVIDISKAPVAPFVQDEILMTPLRLIAEAMGYEVKWDDATSTAYVSNNEWECVVPIGKDSYFGRSLVAIGLTAPLEYGAAPVLVNDSTTYVPANMFALLGYQMNITDNVVNFVK